MKPSFERLYGDVLPSDRNSRILDIGCGAGHFLYYLKRKEYTNFLGIDISPQQVEFCEKNISKNVKQADILEFLKDSEGGYSVIAAHDVLEHIPKEKILKLLKLVLKSLDNGGIFLLRVPNMSNPLSLDSRYRDFTHEVGFTEKTLYQILQMTGFSDIRISSSKIAIRSGRNLIRSFMVNTIHRLIRFLYYIQDFSVPEQLGKNLIVICTN